MGSLTIPVVETDRLILRGPVPADIGTWAACIADPEVTRYAPKGQGTFHERATRTLNVYQQRWEPQPLSAVGWVMTRKVDGQLVGLCGADATPRPDEGELDYYLCRTFWGQGLATEAARAVVRYGFENTSWNRVVAAIVPANIASGRVLEHLGFAYEKHVDYREMTGIDSIALDDPIVAFYSLRRERFQPGDAFYHVSFT